MSITRRRSVRTSVGLFPTSISFVAALLFGAPIEGCAVGSTIDDGIAESSDVGGAGQDVSAQTSSGVGGSAEGGLVTELLRFFFI